MKFSGNLNLEKYWNIILGVGIFFTAGGISANFLKSGMNTEIIEAFIGLGVSMIIIGIACVIAYKEYSAIKPPNAYTGPVAVITRGEIEHNWLSKTLLGIGLIFSIAFLVKMFYLLLF